MRRPHLLDAFCGAGGAGMGYWQVGFDVTGVDIAPQPRYPFDFYQGDAIEFIKTHGYKFDAIHASPPCQYHSNLNAYNQCDYPDLIPDTRIALKELEVPWVIENVPQAPLINPITVCGQELGLLMYRPRKFESPVPILEIPCTPHIKLCARNGYLPTAKKPYMSIHGGKHSKAWQKKASECMGTPWMCTIREVCEAIPPAYTEYVERFLMAEVQRLRLRKAG